MKLGFYCMSLFSFKAEHTCTLEQNNRLPFKMIMIIPKLLLL